MTELDVDQLDATRTYDLGSGVTLRPLLGPEGHEGEVVGAIVDHPVEGGAEGERCAGAVRWVDTGEKDAAGEPLPTWDVVERSPLTLSPSIDCARHPEGHGHVRRGRWVPA